MTTRTERTPFLDVGFDTPELDQLLERLDEVTSDTAFGYVVTPNVDHLVRLHNGGATGPIAPLYAGADLCLCDSKILARLGSLCGIKLPVIPGSDLAALIFTRILRRGDRIAVIGGDEMLIEELQKQFPSIEIVQHRPPMGLAKDAVARQRAARFIADQRARFTFICVGSPQQEMIAAEAAQLPGSRGIALCLGAALEFLSGRQRRAPGLMRRLGLEWAHRLAVNPRRMWRRYLVDGPRIFVLAYRWAHRNT